MALGNTTQAISSTPDSGSTYYYLALFLMVVVVRFFKLKKLTNKDEKLDKRKIFHVGLEVVYTASGLVVLLLDALKAYSAFIVVAYLLIFFTVTSIESMEEKFGENTVFGVNVFILGVAVSLTWYYFEILIPSKAAATNTPSSAQQLNGAATTTSNTVPKWRVVVPYDDYTLRQYLGARVFADRRLALVFDIQAANEKSARQQALKQFADTVRPFREPKEAGEGNKGLITPEMSAVTVQRVLELD